MGRSEMNCQVFVTMGNGTKALRSIMHTANRYYFFEEYEEKMIEIYTGYGDFTVRQGTKEWFNVKVYHGAELVQEFGDADGRKLEKPC